MRSKIWSVKLNNMPKKIQVYNWFFKCPEKNSWNHNFELLFFPSAAKKERIEAVNQAEGVLHDTDSKLDEYGSQLNSEDVAKMKEQIKEVREKLADKDNMTGEEIKKSVSDLQNASMKLFEVAYKKMQSEREASGAEQASKPEEPKESGEKKEEQK